MAVVRTLKLCGMERKTAEEYLADLTLSKTPQTDLEFVFRIRELPGEVCLTFSFSEQTDPKKIEEFLGRLKEKLGDAVYADRKNVTLEMAVVQELTEKGMTVSTAESCTGGMVSARLVNVSGASQVFMEGRVTYSNEAKQRLLGVKEETLAAWGAVSSQTAEEMAAGGAKAAGTDVCVAITGLAGPGGGTETKPVGLVYMSCWVRGRIQTRKYLFQGNREEIRSQSAAMALNLIRLSVRNYREQENDNA